MIKTNQIVAAFLLIGTAVFSNFASAYTQLDGSTVYQRQCAMCHGNSGKNRLPNAANFQNREGMRQSNQQLFERIRRGKNGCPSYAGLLNDQQIISVIGYLRSLGR